MDNLVATTHYLPRMKRKSFISSLLFASLVAAVSPALANTNSPINPWETVEGSVGLKGLGVVNGIAFSDVKVSAKLGAQADGIELSGPAGVFPASNSVIDVFGEAQPLAKLTNKEILEASQVDPKGNKIRWARVGGVAKLQIYDKNGPIKEVPANVLTADVSWANNYVGVYGGGADLTATPTASGTQVIVSSGKLNGLTALSGSALGYIPFYGVGKFTADAKKQLSTTVRVAGIGEQ